MFFLDVNILVHAIQSDHGPDSPAVFAWLNDRTDGPEAIGVSEYVLASMTRIATNRRIFPTPNTPEQCMEFIDVLLGAPSVQPVRPGPRHWPIFRDLVTGHRLRGNDVPDAYLASLAMEQGATFVTLDRGFGRFEGLRTLDPLA